jgi:uncharacterized membrane protein YidH (DUF202 family)
MKKIFTAVSAVSFASLVAVFAPFVASAQSLSSLNNINDVSNRFTSILNTATVLIISIAVIWIIINVVRFFVGAKDSEKRHDGIMQVIWGIVGIFIIISIWGLVSILKNSFGTNDTASQGINNVEVQSVPQIQ